MIQQIYFLLNNCPINGTYLYINHPIMINAHNNVLYKVIFYRDAPEDIISDSISDDTLT